MLLNFLIATLMMLFSPKLLCLTEVFGITALGINLEPLMPEKVDSSLFVESMGDANKEALLLNKLLSLCFLYWSFASTTFCTSGSTEEKKS